MEATAAWYYNDLCDRDYDDVDAGVRVAAMADLGFKSVIEENAAALIARWRAEHQATVSRMPRSVRDLIEPLWHLGSSPLLPTTVEARDVYPAATEKVVGNNTETIATYPDHLYVIPGSKENAGQFPVDTSRSSWERKVLEAELGVDSLVGWYRNPSSGRNALAVPYEFGGQHLLMHPDFLFWHDDGDAEYVMDIVDPHRHDLADTGPKWRALARYAQDHSDRVRRCFAVIEVGGRLRALDLTADGIDEQLARATDQVLIEMLFEDAGMDY